MDIIDFGYDSAPEGVEDDPQGELGGAEEEGKGEDPGPDLAADSRTRRGAHLADLAVVDCRRRSFTHVKFVIVLRGCHS